MITVVQAYAVLDRLRSARSSSSRTPPTSWGTSHALYKGAQELPDSC